MAAIQRSPGVSLRKTFGTVAVLLVLGLLWLAFFRAGSSPYKGVQDSIGTSGGKVASTGIGFQPMDAAILNSFPTLGAANDAGPTGSGDNIAVLAIAGAFASAFSILVFLSVIRLQTLKLRLGSLSPERVQLRQITGA